jgi:uncharacterized protein (TIGR02722 family)
MAALSGCTTFQGEYSDPEKAEIIDDKWNETDARKTAEVLITSCLGRPWLKNFKATHNNQAPVVVVADVENRTDEHIDTKALTEFIQNELINSGKVRFVNKERRQQILDEVNYQHSGNVSDKSRKKKGNQIGADYMLAGAISSHVHSQGGLKKVTYQTVLNLTNLETSEIQWNEKHEVSKRFKRSGSGW